MNVTDREYGRLKKLSSQWSGKISKLHLSHPVFLSLLPNAELTSGGLIAETLRKAQDIVNCENSKIASVLGVCSTRLCTPGMGVNLWGATRLSSSKSSPLCVNPVHVVIH